MQHKQQLRDRLAALTQVAQLKQPQTLAAQLRMATDGAFAERRYLDPRNVGNIFKDTARALIKQAM
ncbi:MAG: hypothetical protein ACFBSF_05005 [Leptolyngbyaceae cyanobacterium]